jgi:2-oxoacid:acceptor oxidoreductase gamma subunit (pyruvate/2-ketoisovalerate family)
MIEIRYHGRGGQGSVVASKILADAAFKEGNDVQSFPYFGVERRGAPVTAFTRIDGKPIRIKSEIYEPDYIVILDPSLVGAVDMTYGIKPDTMILVNSSKDPSGIDLGVPNRMATVDATGIALDNKLGSMAAPIVNTAIVGAFCRMSGVVKIESVEAAIREIAPVKKDANVKAARDAYEALKSPDRKEV